ncbi:MAG: serine/threonine kinase family protein [Myxococcales bacterium]|nr:serine/threonine kinase family protein [Myxococcales bacterium]
MQRALHVHVDDNAIEAFVGGRLSGPEASAVRSHLDGCADCLSLVACVVKQASAGGAPTLPAVPALGSAPETTARLDRKILTRGAKVGPYVIERLVGIGGMGVVYAAHDPRLDRTVALKLIRTELGPVRDELVQRLRRESKALARLSHPNVTTVYELGTAEGEVYVAMEYVAGTNLRAWQVEARRTPREILAAYTRAGIGLAAAHAVGLVHRDFKPDNVLMAQRGSDQGSVKVTDFGLARLGGEVVAVPTDVDPQRVRAPSDHELTMTGMFIGTPAYMAPEQFNGDTVDARADQFAFCVALYEALHGERPFRGATVDELRTAVLAGRLEPGRSVRVPGRVRRALVRGLSPEPARRFASMDALLAAIAPRRGVAILAVGGLAAATTAALAATLLSQAPAEKPCQGAAAEVEAVWSAARRNEVRYAFLATGSPAAAQAWTAVERRIDSYVGGWSAMHVGACEATRVHRQQSEAVLDLRMTCLERRRSELDALVTVFARADVDTVAHAREATASLPDVSPCADVESLNRRTRVPSDPFTRQRHDGLRGRIDQARAWVEVSNYKAALPALVSIVGDPAIQELPALEAEAQLQRAKVLTATTDLGDAEQVLFRALVRAQAARADDLVATAAIDLAYVTGYRSQRAADGKRWLEFAAAAIDGKGGDDLLAVRLATVRANILLKEGKLDEAEAENRKALALVVRRTPGGTLEADVLDTLGSSLSMQGKREEAIPMLEKALAIRERTYGTVHSLTTSTRQNLANALGSLRRYDDAFIQYRQVLSASEAMFGREGQEVARVLSNMGQLLQEQHRLADARPLLERALAIREKAHGPAHPLVARTLANLGYLLLDEHAYADALDRFTRVGTILTAALGPDHPSRADDLAGTGSALLGLKRPADAIAPLERAVQLIAKDPSDPVWGASVDAKLAQALFASRRDRARAATLGASARKVLLDAGETAAVTELDAWLPRR